MILGGSKGSSPKPKAPVNEPNTLQSKQILRAAVILGEGPIQGLANGEESIFFGGVPLRNPDGTYNFEGVRWEIRYGLPDQDPVALLPEIERPVDIGTWVEYGSPVTHTITDENVDTVRVRLVWPGLVHQESDGDVRGAECAFRIWIQEAAGPAIVAYQTTLSGKTMSTYERDVRINLRSRYQYNATMPINVRVERLTPDPTDDYLKTQFQFAGVTELIDEKLIYPNTAYLAVEMDAALFGDGDPDVSVEILGRLVQVPSNYDPVSRVYTGLWDGTFKAAWTDNPAWIIYDIVTDSTAGMGGQLGLGPDAVDKWDLYAIGRYCDELVPDGYGGYEPRFRCSCNLQTQQDALDLLTSLAAVMRGKIHAGYSGIVITQDAPADPIAEVSPANVIDGIINYSEAPIAERYTVAIVMWHDPADSYRPKPEIVEDYEAIRRIGYRSVTIAAVGCTSRGQAHRAGKWLLAEQDTKSVTYQAGADHFDLLPFDILNCRDTVVIGARYGGRIRQATLNQVVLDAPVELQAGETYQLSVVLPDKTLAEREITTGPGTTDTLAVASPLPAVPQVAAMWGLTASNAAPQQIRLISKREADTLIYECTALIHDPAKYDRIETGIYFDPPPTSLLPTGGLGRPDNVTVTEWLRQDGSALLVGAQISWTPPDDVRVQYFEAEYRRSGETVYSALGQTSSPSAEVSGLQSGVYYDFRVRGVGYGRPSAWIAKLNVKILGLYSELTPVTDLEVVYSAGKRILAWGAYEDLRPVQFEVRRGLTIGTSQLQGVTAEQQFAVRGPGTYWVRAKYRNVYSAPVGVTIEGAGPVANVVATLDQAAGGWAGTKTNLVVDDGDLVLDGADGSGTYTIPAGDRVTLSAPALCGVSVAMTAYGVGPGDDVYDWSDIYAVQDIYGSYGDQVSAVVQIRTLSTEDVWSEWRDLKGTEYVAKGFDFRVVVVSASAEVNVELAELVIVVDVPDRVIAVDDVWVPISGLHLTFTPPFNAVPTVIAQVLNAAGGEDVEVTNKAAAAVDLRVLQGGNPVAKNINYIVQGY